MSNKQYPKEKSVFDITDYTTASDWERFVANLEQILTDWKLTKSSNYDYNELPIGAITSGIWHEEQEFIKHGMITFEIKYLRLDHEATRSITPDDQGSDSPEFHDASANALQDDDDDDHNKKSSESNGDNDSMIQEDYQGNEFKLPKDLPECLNDLVSTNNDFASRAHCLVRWYNFRKFILIKPRGDTLISDDAIRIILSSASIALANVDCHIPIMVQHHNPRNFLFQGVSEHRNIRTTYEMVYLKSNLKQYEYVSELIGMFRNKVGCQLSDPINVSIRLNYCLNSFRFISTNQESYCGIETHQVDDATKELVEITSRTNQSEARSIIMDLKKDASFEQVVDAIRQGHPKPHNILQFLHVAALWPPVSDKVIVDSQVHSDLDPPESPIWTMRCVTSDNTNMKIVHDTQAIHELFCDSIEYAYTHLDAKEVFDDCDKQSLKDRCLRLSYQLAKQPEVILSEVITDSLRKLVALLFHRANEMTRTVDEDADHDVDESKQQPTLNEIYKQFGSKNRTSIKEFIIRSQVSRPFQPKVSPALPQRMFCSIRNSDFRLCGAFSELCS